MHASCLSARLSPHRIYRSHRKGLIRMIWRKGHNWSLNTIDPFSLIQPFPIFFLGKDLSPMHSVLLFI